MAKEILNNNLNDDELKKFLDGLSDSRYIESIIRDEMRYYQKTSIIKYYILSWIKQGLIKKEDSLGEFLSVLDLKEMEILKNNILTTKEQDKLKEIKIIKQHIGWLITETRINLNISIEEFLEFLKNLIEEKKRFLLNPPKPQK